MTSSPEHDPEQPQNDPIDTADQPWIPSDTSSPRAWETTPQTDHPAVPPESIPSWPSEPPVEPWTTSPQPIEPPLFQLEPRPIARIPNFGHVLLLLVLLSLIGTPAMLAVMALAVHGHLFGVSTAQQAVTNIHYLLGSEGLLYIFTLLPALLIFPHFWHKGLFEGLEWHGATAVRLRNRLFAAAVVCFLLALLNGELLPGPTNTPIEKVFRAPGAAWLLFAFGVTFAPFFEEMFFRGFLLPSLCTAWDWAIERSTGKPALPLNADGAPQWSLFAMLVGSILTSIPFAWMHAAQTGYSIGPFMLLVGVSLVLCTVRLVTRSLASSVLVHASYNFLLFSVMLIASSGFRHLNNL